MSKRTRQIVGIFAAIVAYYIIHEGAHLLYALCIDAFRQIRFMGLGVQIDVYAGRMTDTQLGIFCLVGVFATFCAAYLLTIFAKQICKAKSKLLRAVIYYITIAFFAARSAVPEHSVRFFRRRRYERYFAPVPRMGGKSYIRIVVPCKRICVFEVSVADI